MKQIITFSIKFQILIALCGLLLFSCNSTQKIINTGNYDQAIARSVNKLRKNKKKEKHIEFLQDAFYRANQEDLEQIKYLKKQNSQGDAYGVFQHYAAIKDRQYKVKPLMPLYISSEEVPFEFLDVDSELIHYKNEAAVYLYDHASELLKSNEKYDARKAHLLLGDLIRFDPDYKDAKTLFHLAYDKGQNNVLFSVINRSPNIIPLEFEEELYSQDFKKINGQWYKFTAQPDRIRNQQFDFAVEVLLDIVDVGAERIREKEYVETKSVQDGFRYEYDGNGNVKKDSLGNDIKIPKYKEISSRVIEAIQTKQAVFKGKIEMRDLSNNQLIRSEPINVTFVFNHESAVAEGNPDALSNETKQKLNNNPIPFPTDFQMIMDGSSEIRPVIANFIKRNDHHLEI